MNITRTVGLGVCAALLVACGSKSSGAPSTTSTHGSSAPSTTHAAGTTIAPGAAGATSTTLAGAAASTTAATAPASPPPANLPPKIPHLNDIDGKWHAEVTLGGRPVVWVGHYWPLADNPSIIASAAVVEQSALHAALFNGPIIPGPGTWKNGSRVPKSLVPSLVAAFNGGFEFQHMFHSGFKTEGKEVKPLENGTATIAVSHDGHIKVGILGVDIKDDGTWLSLRQNLPPVVINGRTNTNSHSENVWGTNYGGVMVSNRSGVCTRFDGRIMFVYVGLVRVTTFAKVMVEMGCKLGMQLDINGTWPQFTTYSGFGTTTRSGNPIDSRMTNPDRYLNHSQKDFIAFFDPATLPDGILA
jgi:hypothetical protein